MLEWLRFGGGDKKKKKVNPVKAFMGPMLLMSPELMGRSDSALYLRAKQTQSKKYLPKQRHTYKEMLYNKV